MDFQATQRKIKELLSRLFQKNKYERVLKDYVALSQSRPNDTRIKLKIAETHFKTRDIPNAIAVYREVARDYIAQNFMLKAVSVYKTILKLDPQLVDVNLSLAELYLKLEMNGEAANQYRIAMQHFGTRREQDKLLEICQKLVQVDPTANNRRKLAEVYQSLGMSKQAVEQYEILAQVYRQEKRFDDLLHIYELIIPHQPDNQNRLKDMCILYLRKQDPDSATRLIERYKMDANPAFAQIYDKAKLMKKALRATSASLKKPKTA